VNIWIVDDSETAAELARYHLRHHGFDAVEVEHSPVAFLNKFAALPQGNPDACPDLVLLDQEMPELNGLQALGKIRAMSHMKNVPVVMVTASRDRSLLKEAFAAGVSDFICKPIEEIELVCRVQSLLKLRQETQKRKQREHELEIFAGQLQEANSRLETLSMQDGLTGLANRRHFDEVLSREIARRVPYPNPVSLILVDVDHFKLFNDTYGHLAGDDCLRAIAKILAGAAQRATDLVARYGGEEFALILPGARQADCETIAGKLIQSVAAACIPHAASPISLCVTVSVGAVTALVSSPCASADLIHAADTNLYRAKKEGRARSFHTEIQRTGGQCA